MAVLSSHPGIAIIVHSVRHGSVGGIAWRHAIEFSRDHDVFVLSADDSLEEHQGISHISIRSPDFRALRRLAHLPSELAFQRMVRKKLRQLIRENDIGTVWCHGHGSVLSASRVTRRLKGLKLVLTVHGEVYDRPPGTYDPVMTRYYRWATPRAYQLATHVQVLSPDILDKLVTRSTPKGSVKTIPNGVEPRDIGLEAVEYRLEEQFLRKEDPQLLFVGDLRPVKGVHILLQALALLSARGVGAGLVCVGDGPHRGELERMAHDLGIHDAVSFVGAVPRKKLAAFYLAADLLVLPSANEMLPTVILEGFCAGLPAVGSKIPGNVTLLDEGRGWCFEPGDVDDLARTMQAVLNSQPALHQASRRCSATAADRYSWNSVATALKSWLEA